MLTFANPVLHNITFCFHWFDGVTTLKQKIPAVPFKLI